MKRITMAHGSGGAPMHSLIKDLVLKELGNPVLNKLSDSAFLQVGGKIAFTTDSYVVKPIFFPGGDIGRLAVSGTVNDLAVCGAKPLYLSCGIIIEEGLEIAVLKKVLHSVKDTARFAGVKVVTGDIKVVEKGSCDGLYINTSGIGIIKRKELSADKIKVGDKIIINGSIGDHGVSVLSAREGINLRGSLRSDVAPLNKLISKIIKYDGVRFMRDPTRGGVAATLNEVLEGKNYGIQIDQNRIFVKPAVSTAVELLGLDPLYIANEGKVLVVASGKAAPRILKAMRTDKYGKNARIIGEVTKEYKGKVVLKTKVGEPVSWTCR